jgi:folate-dependent phosphoribosylglycinamide formyltransferase PurN
MARFFTQGKPLNVAFLGSGSQFVAWHAIQAAQHMGFRVSCAIGETEDANVLPLGAQYGFPTCVMRPRRADGELPTDQLIAFLESHEVSLAILLDYRLRLSPEALNALDGMVISMHPSMDPKRFMEKGIQGLKIHEEVLAFHVAWSGCTAYFADSAYLHGPVIGQIRVPVLRGDTAVKLAERIERNEALLLPMAVQSVYRTYFAGGIPAPEYMDR